jgi:hypothetical protein
MIYVLDQNNQTKGILRPDSSYSPYYDDSYIERLDGSSELSFSLTVNKQDLNVYHFTDELQVERNIIYRNIDKDLILMRVVEIEEEAIDGVMYKHIYAENLAINELSKVIKAPRNWEADPLGDGFRGDYAEITGYTANDELYEILYNSGYTYLGSDMNLNSILLDSFTRNTYMNAYEQLIELCNIIGAELKFSVELDGMRINKKYVYLANSLGRNTNMTFYYGVDIREAKRTIDSKDLITTVYPVGGSNESRVPLTIENLDTSDSRIVDSLEASGNDFVIDGNRIYSKFSINTFSNGTHRTGIYENSEIGQDIKLAENIANEKIGLALEAINYLEQNCLPKVSYEIKLNYLAQYTGNDNYKSLRLGDEITVIDRTFTPELRIKARVVEMTTSLSDLSKNEVVLGNIRPIASNGTTQIRELNKKIKQLETRKPNTYIKEFIQLTQADYEALTEIDDNTIYFTTEV